MDRNQSKHSNHLYQQIDFSKIPIYPHNLTYEKHQYEYHELTILTQVCKEIKVLQRYYLSCILNHQQLLLVLHLDLTYTSHHDNVVLQVFLRDVL